MSHVLAVLDHHGTESSRIVTVCNIATIMQSKVSQAVNDSIPQCERHMRSSCGNMTTDNLTIYEPEEMTCNVSHMVLHSNVMQANSSV